MTYTPRRALRVLAEEFETNATVESIARIIYKGTSCGCYFDFVGETIIIGTIIEGSDAEYSVELDLADYQDDNAGDSCLVDDVKSAIDTCETFVEEYLIEDYLDEEGDYSDAYGDFEADMLGW